MKIRQLLATILIVTATAVCAHAIEVSEIVDKANLAAYYGGDDGKATVKMVIRGAGGDERTREFTILRLDETDGGNQFFYVYFHKPGDVRKTVFMVHKKVGDDDDRWLYLPALDLVKRIGATDKRTSFMGSHFFYEDVSGRGVNEDNHQLTETTDTAYVLTSTPKDPGSVEFASYKLWVDKESFLPTRIEYVNAKGERYRVVEALEVKTIDNIPTVVHSKVTDEATGGSTEMFFSDIAYNIGLDASVFTERSLRSAPRKYIR